jgi:putative flippase GtrA
VKEADLFDIGLLARHQAAAGVATAIDYAVMITLVEHAHTAPPVATLISASVGGLANFLLSRLFAFRSIHRGSVRAQAFRYGLACVGGALLNAGLLAILLMGSAPYVLARAVVSVFVSIGYTYPMHTRFVFRAVATDRGAS